jgi:hypothetical protein
LAAHKDYNQSITFIINMGIESGKKRFFVYDYKRNEITDEALVAHGTGSDTVINGKPQLRFSNIPRSYMTSLGKYSIGKSYVGAYGKSYILNGLDKTNDKAAIRNVVLHSFDDIPDEEQNYPITESFGCPMVSPAFFEYLENVIDKSSGKILLYIYYLPNL